MERFYSCSSDTGKQTEELEGQEISNEDDGKQKTYRMHLATVPGDMAGAVSVDKSRSTHIELISKVEELLNKIDVKCQVLDPSGFSCSDEWGIELFGCLLVTCTRTDIRGFCALLGMAFQSRWCGRVHLSHRG